MSLIRPFAHIANFRSDVRGSVAMLFALSTLPMLFMAGAAIDYGRALKVRAQLQSVVDSTALALVREPRGTPVSRLQERADAYLAAMAERKFTATSSIRVNVTGDNISVTARATMPTVFMKLVRQDVIDLGAAATATYARPKLQVALVLDNTGSMGFLGKMPALQTAATDLVTRLEGMAQNPGDVKVSLVPFNTQVRVDSTFASATWLRWDGALENPAFSPAMAAAPTPATWGGCISDRDQPYDVSGQRPVGGTSNYVAANCHYGSLQRMIGLTTNFSAVRTAIADMTPTGATNVTIGAAVGLAALTADSPFGHASSSDPDVQRFMIVLTDGNNTQNRWGGNGSEGNLYVPEIDRRLSQACAEARNRGVQVFTVRVIAGNEPLLRSCATNTSMYYSASSAAEIAPIFARILEQISKPRLTM